MAGNVTGSSAFRLLSSSSSRANQFRKHSTCAFRVHPRRQQTTTDNTKGEDGDIHASVDAVMLRRRRAEVELRLFARL